MPGVEIGPAGLKIRVGQSRTIESVVHDFDGKRLHGRALLWSSQDPETARVSPEGLVEAFRPGSVLITASTGQKSATIEVEVLEAGPAPGAGTTSGPFTPTTTLPPMRSRSSDEDRGASRRPIVIGLVATVALVVAVSPFVLRSGRRATTQTPLGTPEPTQPALAAADSADIAYAGGPATADSTTASATRQSTRETPESGGPEAGTAARQPEDRIVTNTAAGGARARESSAATNPTRPDTQATYATLRLGSGLPEGAVVTLRNEAGETRRLTGQSTTLPAGGWYGTVTAPGYQEATERIDLAAGETRTWSPRLNAIPAPPASPTAQATVDRSADREAVNSAVQGFVAALGRRDADRVVTLLPPDAQDGWRTLLTSRFVSDFSASLRSVGEPTFDEDTATADIVIGVSFQSSNQTQTPTLRYTGVFERTGTAWRLVSLRPSGG